MPSRKHSSRRSGIAAPALLAFALSPWLASCGSEPTSSDTGVAEDVQPPDGRAAAPDREIEADVPVQPLDWSACDTSDWPSGWPPPSTLECTTVSVPLDYSAPSGKSLDLRVARIRSKGFPTGRAIFYIEGGPGGSSVVASGVIAGAPLDVAASFDLVFVDLRGTGGSGYLGCTGSPKTTADWIACGKAQSADLDHFLSADAARDLDTVRSRIGYPRISLYAVSYGTRVAFDYLRLFPDQTTAAVLDGVAPPPVDLFSDTISSADRGLALLVSDCGSDPACLAVSPTLSADLAARRAALKQSPRAITVDGVKNQETEADFVVFVRQFLHYWYPRYKMPKAIHQAVLGDNKLWDELLSEYLGQTVAEVAGTAPKWKPPSRPLRSLRPPYAAHRRGPEMFGASFSSDVVYLSMLCAESFPNSPGLSALDALQAQQSWAGTTMNAKAAACPSWPVSAIPDSERQYLSSSARVLLVSGAIDVNVDPKWAESAVTGLGQGHLVVIPYATHLPTEENPCAGKIASAYLAADGDYSKVDASCLKTLPSPGWD